MTEATRARIAWLGLPAAIIALAVLRALTQLRDIDLRIATYAVSSPLGFIGLHVNPEMAAMDWPAGSADFKLSLPMKLLLWIVQGSGIAPEALLWPFGFAQIVAFLAAVAYLAHMLFRHAPTTIAIVCVAAISPCAGVNLGNFGAGIGNYSPVLFYTAANALKLLALALFLKGRPIAAALALAAALHTHLSLGLFMLMFVAAGALAAPRVWIDRGTATGVVVFAVLIAPLAITVLDSNVATGAIRSEDWVFMSRLFNWHWHPIETGLFGPLAAIGILPLGILVLAYAAARRHVSANPDTDRFLLAGMLAAAAATVIGIVFSEAMPVPVIMKFAPQRSSELITLIALFYLVRDFVRRMQSGQLVEAVICAWCFMLAMTASMGLALVPLLVLATLDAHRARQSALFAACVAALLAVVVIGVIDSLAGGRIAALDPGLHGRLQAFVAGLWTPLQQLSPLRAPDYALFGGTLSAGLLALTAAFTLLVGVLALLPTRYAPRRAGCVYMALLVFGAFALYVVQENRWRSWAESNREHALAYKAAQMWAASNAPPAALFMGDPGYATGWREYATRAYFGALAELAHFATLYDSVPGLFDRGLARVREFGVDPLALDRSSIAMPGGGKYGISVLAAQASRSFNAMPTRDLIEIARRHGVDYVITRRSARPQGLEGMSPAYENAHYAIYALPSG